MASEYEIICPSTSVIKRGAREFKYKIKRSSNKAISVRFRPDGIVITFKDGRVLITPLSLHPTLQKATPAQRRDYYIEDGEIISWERLEYHLSAVQMLNPFAGCCD